MVRVICILALSLSVGCGPTKPGPAPAKGVVKTKAGVACEGALVVFHPQENERINAAKPVATADAQGNFVLTTHAQNDGAIPGDYGVTVVWPGKTAALASSLSLSSEGSSSSPDRLAGKYGNPQSPILKVRIEKAGNQEISLVVEP